MLGTGPEVVALLRDIGFYRIAGSDGCACTRCIIRGFEVSVSCWRSTAGLSWLPSFHGIVVRVSSRALDVMPVELEIVSQEVCRQLREYYSVTPIAIRYCTLDDDNKKKCIYCHAEREKADGYLCRKCLASNQQPAYVGVSVAQQFDYQDLQTAI